MSLFTFEGLKYPLLLPQDDETAQLPGYWRNHVPKYERPYPMVKLGAYLAFYPHGRPGDQTYRPPTYNQGRRAGKHMQHDDTHRPRVLVSVLDYKVRGTHTNWHL